MPSVMFSQQDLCLLPELKWGHPNVWGHPNFVFLSCHGSRCKLIHLTKQGEDATQHPHQQRQSHAATVQQNSFRRNEDPTAHHGPDNEGHSRQQPDLPPEAHHLVIGLLFPVIFRFLCRCPLHFPAAAEHTATVLDAGRKKQQRPQHWPPLPLFTPCVFLIGSYPQPAQPELGSEPATLSNLSNN